MSAPRTDGGRRIEGDPPSPEPTGPDMPESARRRVWLDGARGVVLALMLITPAFGPGDSQRWLRHSPWDGLTVSDLVFPTFLVLSGASLWFLLRRGWNVDVRRRLVRRFLALMVIGLVYNAWDLGADLSALRFTGVLQTIGIAGAAAVIVIRLTGGRRGAVLAVAAIATAAWSLLVSRPCPGRCSPMFWLDRTVLPDRHLYRQATAGFDPEGLGQMAVATALVLFGWWAVSVVTSPRVRWQPLAVFGGCLALGIVTALLHAPNKRLGNAPYAALAATAAFSLMIAAHQLERLRLGPPGGEQLRLGERTLAVFAVLGRNALVVFVGERFVNASLAHTEVDGRPAYRWIADELGVPDRWLGLVIGAFVLTLMYTVTSVMSRLRWRIVL